MTSDRWTSTKHRLIASALSFVAGYTDIISVTRWRVFATMLTGNLIFVGRSTIHSQSQYLTGVVSHDVYAGTWYYIVVILTFCCGVAAWRVAEHFYKDRGASTVGIPFAFLMVAMELVLLLSPRVLHDFPIIYSLTVLAYAPMFGVMTAACMSGRLATTTTAATGHFVVLVSTMVKQRFLQEELNHSERAKRGMGVAILGSTLAGAMVGTLVYICTDDGSHGALVPVGPALAVLFWLHDHLARPSSLVKKVQALPGRMLARTQSTIDTPLGASPGSASDDDFDDDSDDDCDVDNYDLEAGFHQVGARGESDQGGEPCMLWTARVAPMSCEHTDHHVRATAVVATATPLPSPPAPMAPPALPTLLTSRGPLTVRLLQGAKRPSELRGFCSEGPSSPGRSAVAPPRWLLRTL